MTEPAQNNSVPEPFVAILNARAGDTVLINYPQPLNAEQLDAVRRQLDSVLPPGVRAAVTCGVDHVSLVKAGSEPQLQP